MNQRQFFEHVLRTLEDLRVPYMVTGSVAAIAYGEPRLTNDMDVVLELAAESVDRLAAAFPAGRFYFPPHATVNAEIVRRGQFNVIHVESGSKVDFILRKDSEFSRTEFARRKSVPFTGELEAISATPEDIILSKLRFYEESRSEKHASDIRGMLRVSGDSLDLEYLEGWAARLGLSSAWRAVRRGAGS